MMITKVKISLREGVVELEGSEEFVERQIDKIENLINLFEGRGVQNHLQKDLEDEPTSTEDQASNSSTSSMSDALKVPASFGDWMHKFQDDINDQQKALVASYYVQSKSNTNDFKTLEVNQCLKDHGIKLANPSTSIQRLATKKQTFQTRKVGKLIYMRVSKDGEAHLKTLLR